MLHQPEIQTKNQMEDKKKLVSKEYLLPFILITSLFFMWGFARSILDVLNKHFQDSMDITITKSTLIQATTYLGYFLMALPAGIIITRYGYRRGVVFGLLLFAIGSLMFIPGGQMMSFDFFLISLFVIGCGLAVLETAANPYASELGDKATAASRLNLAQAFNGLGCILGPVIVGGFLFSSENSGSVSLPYGIMGVFVLLVAFVFMRTKLPEIKTDADEPSEKSEKKTITQSIRNIWSNGAFRFGILALFCYEIAEISINSLFLNYVTSDGWMDKVIASQVLSFGALGLFMAARVIGSWIMSKIPAAKVLCVCGVMTVAGALLVVSNIGILSKCGLFACYAFEAIMFPTIFAVTIGHVIKDSKIASSFLMMTPIGGAVGTFLMGVVADTTTLSSAFIVPALGYLVVTLFAVNLLLKNKKH